MRILLVEDEVVTARMIRRKLSAEGFEVDWMENCGETLAYLSYEHYDVIILDLRLPDGNGITVLESLRKKGIKIPILILTQCSVVENMLTAFATGADDYMTKPFIFTELYARLMALTRRAYGLWAGRMEYGGLSYVLDKRLLSFKGGSVVLSKREGQLLELLLRQDDKTVTRELVLNYIWGGDQASSNNADTLAAQLRRKMCALPAGVLLEAIRGVGYRLTIE